MQLDSLVLAALRPINKFVQVRSAKHAITAGRQRKAAAMAVGLWSFIYSSSKLINRYPFPGRHCGGDPAVKEELKSPGNSVPSKQRIYSTTNVKPIGRMDSMDVFEEGSLKCQKLGSGRSAHVHFDSMILNKPQATPQTTRKLMRATRANTKKGVCKLFERLGQEFKAVAKTCEEISGALN